MPELTSAKTKYRIDALLKNLPQALLVVSVAPNETKRSAEQIISKVIDIDDIYSYPYGLVVTSLDNKKISIEEVRRIEAFLKLKVTSQKEVNRFVLIEGGEKLGLEAQNALLKTLEEPAQGSFILITATSDRQLIPTLKSRLQKIIIEPPTKDEILDQLNLEDSSAIDVAIELSGGDHEQLTAHLNQTAEPDESLRIARDLLTKTRYQRLILINEFSGDKVQCLKVINNMQKLASASLKRSPKNQEKWINISDKCYEAISQLNTNAQNKLVMLNLMLSI